MYIGGFVAHVERGEGLAIGDDGDGAVFGLLEHQVAQGFQRVRVFPAVVLGSEGNDRIVADCQAHIADHLVEHLGDGGSDLLTQGVEVLGGGGLEHGPVVLGAGLESGLELVHVELVEHGRVEEPIDDAVNRGTSSDSTGHQSQKGLGGAQLGAVEDVGDVVFGVQGVSDLLGFVEPGGSDLLSGDAERLLDVCRVGLVAVPHHKQYLRHFYGLLFLTLPCV